MPRADPWLWEGEAGPCRFQGSLRYPWEGQVKLWPFQGKPFPRPGREVS